MSVEGAEKSKRDIGVCTNQPSKTQTPKQYSKKHIEHLSNKIKIPWLPPTTTEVIIYAPENIKVFAQTFVCVFSYLARVCEVSLIVKMLATDVENTEKLNVIETT